MSVPILQSIQTRLIAGIGLATSVLIALLGWYWSDLQEHELSQALSQREERMARLVARGFAGPVWNLDLGAIGTLLDAAMEDPELHSVELSAQGLSRGLGGEPLRRERSTPAVQPIRREVLVLHQLAANAPTEVVGKATLVFTSELVLQQVAQTRRFVAGLLAAVLAAVVVVSYILVHRFVKQPVSRLGAMASRVAAGELGVATAVHGHDEIGQLTEQFNQMSARLQSSREELRRSEKRYRSLFENATEGIFQVDARGRLLSLNHVFTRMLGLPDPAQLLARGARLRQLVRLEPAEYRRIVRALLRHRVLQQVSMHVTTLEGRSLWVELSVHLVSEAQDQALRIEGMLSDISRRRLAEQELTHHRDHLEDLVAARTRELNAARLRAETANQSKSRFLAAMSHEFRTPLNAILGFAQLLQMDASLDAAQHSKIELIRDSGEHLLSLISDLLDMASIEAGKVLLQPSMVDLRALLDVSCDGVRLRAEQKGLQFTLDAAAMLPPHVFVDGKRLRQVLLNLLSNAVKFTESGGLELQVRPLSNVTGVVQLRFEVRDSGIGIEPTQLDRLFKPFEQLGEGSDRAGGTGLGLSISQQLVALMGGQIKVKSVPGQGSVFSFDLELATV